MNRSILICTTLIFFSAFPGRRTGEAPEPKLQEVINKQVRRRASFAIRAFEAKIEVETDLTNPSTRGYEGYRLYQMWSAMRYPMWSAMMMQLTSPTAEVLSEHLRAMLLNFGDIWIMTPAQQVNDAKEVTNAKQHVARGIKATSKYFQVILSGLDLQNSDQQVCVGVQGTPDVGIWCLAGLSGLPSGGCNYRIPWGAAGIRRRSSGHPSARNAHGSWSLRPRISWDFDLELTL